MAIVPKTLIEIAGGVSRPSSLTNSVLVIIDAQNEYRDGNLPLTGINEAIAETAIILEAARCAGTPVIHIVQHSASGRPVFDPDTRNAEIVSELTPVGGEPVIIKRLPNAFAGTALAATLAQIARDQDPIAVILVGFMTHMCISATARAALDLGIQTTVVAAATATRDLPNPMGGVVPARIVQETALAELADRFAAVARDSSAVINELVTAD